MQIIFVLSALLPPCGQWAFGESRVQETVSAPLRTKIRVICEIRVLKKYSCHSRNYLPSVSGPSANLVFKKRQSDIRVQKSRVQNIL